MSKNEKLEINRKTGGVYKSPIQIQAIENERFFKVPILL